MRETLLTIERIATGELNVMIVGEYGTGKEWAAHELHRLSRHSSGPFIVVDCAAITPEEAEAVLFGREHLEGGSVEIRQGEFEEAAGGTILLNDIDLLPQHTQVRIARMIETGLLRRTGGDDEIRVSARVIATLHENGGNPPETEKLRQELYYRISPVLLRIPPSGRGKRTYRNSWKRSFPISPGRTGSVRPPEFRRRRWSSSGPTTGPVTSGT